MNAPKAVRITLKALWREFKRCSNRYPPLYHYYVGYGAQASEQLSGFSVAEVSKSFRQAFTKEFDDGWEEWHGPSDLSFFGRFFGNGEGLDEFQRLANSAYDVVCEADVNGYGRTKDGTIRRLGFHGWMTLLHETAFAYPTALLQCFVGPWWNEARPMAVPRVVIPDDESAPYPLDVFCTELSQSVFLSSMAAIEIFLDVERVAISRREPGWIPGRAWRNPCEFLRTK